MKPLFTCLVGGLMSLLVWAPSLYGQHQIQSIYLQEPDSILPHLLESADFWTLSIDSIDGGFYTEVNRDGTPERTDRKSFVQCSRHAYGFSRAFMVSGDTTYLNYAEHALDFLYTYGWDDTYLGWFFSSDKQGTPAPPYGGGWNPNNEKWSFHQHYNVLGIGAMVEATRASRHQTWLDEAVRVNDSLLWDSRPGFEGFYSRANGDWNNPRDKGFTPTVDGVTTWVLTRALLSDAPEDADRLLALADNIVDHLYESMQVSSVQFGFAENYNTNWVLNGNSTGGSVGHVIKTAWCLARAYMFSQDPVYLEAAQFMIDDMMYNGGYDYTNGGLYMGYQWNTGSVEQNKDYWMLEQGVTSGLINYFLASDSVDQELNLGMADGCLDFFMTNLVDPVYGEIYSQTNASGGVINDDKSDPFKGGYHNIEMAYLTYLYGHLFVHENPVSLYYRFEADSMVREFKMTPLAIIDSLLSISEVELDGVAYQNFDAQSRVLTLPANVGGIFKVTYNLDGRPSPITSAPAVAQTPIRMFPNPAQDRFMISGLNAAAKVNLYTLSGQQVRQFDGVQNHTALSLEGVPTGLYLVEVESNGKHWHQKLRVQ